MRSRLRLFVVVGLVATAVDIGVLLAASRWNLVVADVVALAAAAVVAYLLNRMLTFRGFPDARWVRRPSWFAATATAAGLVDLVVLSTLVALGLVLIGAKLAAVLTAAILRWFVYRRILFKQVRRELAQQLERPPAPGTVRLSVVLPAYEEEALIGRTIETIARELTDHHPDVDFEIVVVDDGSPDDTSGRAATAGAKVVRLDTNRGKGAAVRAGVDAADGRTIVFTDADLAYAPELIVDVMDRVEAGWDVVVGSRRHDDTNTLVRARRLRELGGRFINLLTYIVLLGHFRDTQCGLKGFRSDVGRTIFERIRIDGFAFDVEIFLIAEQDRLSLTEVPVSVANRPGSSVRIVGDTLALLVDLVRIRRWAGGGAYLPDADQAALLAAGRRTATGPGHDQD